MLSKSIMVQGTASTVGKSFLVTALCRIFKQDGYEVNPFKSQNMSLNSFITPEGGEMGRAQVAQAEAAGKLPHVDMNPILLKPASDRKSQVIVNGSVLCTMDAKEYFDFKPCLKDDIKKSYERLLSKSDIVVLEGAGSPAEINLNKNDIVNMGMAEMAKAPVILAADIDKGGVFASLVGTLYLLSEKEKKMVKGIVINKFRGDVELLKPGIVQLEEMTGVPVLGVLPMTDIKIEEEDSDASYKNTIKEDADLEIGVLKLPYLSNFTDADALALEPGTNVRFVSLGEDLDGLDMILLPGTKSTMAALQAVRDAGMDKKLRRAWERGCYLFGICGGYQLLGKQLYDIHHVESERERAEGLGFLDISTSFATEKKTVLSEGRELLCDTFVKGYEIHMGREERQEGTPYFLQTGDGFEGAVNCDGTVAGTYFHGIFDNGTFARAYLNRIRLARGKKEYIGDLVDYRGYRERQYDLLADLARKHLDMDKIYEIVRDGL